MTPRSSFRTLADPEHRVPLALAAAWTLTAAWFLFWPVPTEVRGAGVVIVPEGARVIDSRAEGQILSLPLRAGQRVRKGQTLITLYLPALEEQLKRLIRDLQELRQINADLDRRDQLRLATARGLRDTALARLDQDSRRFQRLRRVYDQKVSDFRHLAVREVVAPLAGEVVATEDRAIQLDASLAGFDIRRSEALDAYSRVRLEIETEAQKRRFRIDDTQRSIRTLQAKLGYLGRLNADRDGRILDLQVVPGQTVKAGQRLGTLGMDGDAPPRVIAYFAPADARRLRPGLPVEVVPDWDERGRFGGIVGHVRRVNLLPATREDVDTTLGNPELAAALVKSGPVMRTEIALESNGDGNGGGNGGGGQRPRRRSLDGYRWTLSRGSSVFPVRQGLTLTTHAYVEWRPPVSYVLPLLRDLTGSYRTLEQNHRERRQLRQRGALP